MNLNPLVKRGGVIAVGCPSCRQKLRTTAFREIKKQADASPNKEAAISLYCKNCGFDGAVSVLPASDDTYCDMVDIIVSTKNKAEFPDGLFCPFDGSLLHQGKSDGWNNKTHECQGCGSVGDVKISK